MQLYVLYSPPVVERATQRRWLLIVASHADIDVLDHDALHLVEREW
jgi:hypothetical protein